MAIVDSTTTSPSGARALSQTRNASTRSNIQHASMLSLPRIGGGAAIRTRMLYMREDETFHEAPAHEVLLQAQELIDQQFCRQYPVLSNAQLVRVFLKIHLGRHDHEVFAVLFLDSHHRLIEYVELFHGTVDASQAHPREVVKEALRHNAAAVILAHHHPSGVAQPSRADERITLRVKEALELMGVNVIDHLIVGESVTSFVELGLL